MIYTLAFRSSYHSLDKCFKTYLSQLHLKRPHALSVEKKTLTLFPPFLENCPYYKRLLFITFYPTCLGINLC